MRTSKLDAAEPEWPGLRGTYVFALLYSAADNSRHRLHAELLHRLPALLLAAALLGAGPVLIVVVSVRVVVVSDLLELCEQIKPTGEPCSAACLAGRAAPPSAHGGFMWHNANTWRCALDP